MVTGWTDVHVLNVGAGSCTVVSSPSGRTTMVDINDGGKLRSYEIEALKASNFLGGARASQEEAELVDPIEWFTNNIGGTLHRFILSHPDRDHMSGIRRILLGELETTNFWDLDHKRTRAKADFGNNAGAWQDWAVYDTFRRGVAIDNVEWPKRISPVRGDVGNFWTDDDFEIHSPTPELVADGDSADDCNDASYIIRVGEGATSHVLIPGDVEEKAWNNMIEAGVQLRANVLVASHHGRNSGFSEAAMKLILPEVVIVSTAKLLAKDDAVDDYLRHTKNVFSTRDHGTISIRMYANGDLQVLSSDGRLAALHDVA